MLYKRIAFEEPYLPVKPKGETRLVPDSGIRAAFFLLNFAGLIKLVPVIFLLVFAYGCATTQTSTVPKGVYYSISKSSIEHGDPDKAIEGLLQIPKGERDYKYYLLLAEAYRIKGNFPLSIENYKRALEKDKSSEEAKLGLAEIYIIMGKYDLSEKYLKDLTQSKNTKIQIKAKIKLGLIYLKLGKYSEAEKILLEVLEKDPENWEANFRLGLVYNEKGNYEKAISYLKEALMGTAEAFVKAEIYYNLGLAYYKKGDIGSAKDAWKGAVKIDPYGEFGQKAQAKLDLL